MIYERGTRQIVAKDLGAFAKKLFKENSKAELAVICEDRQKLHEEHRLLNNEVHELRAKVKALDMKVINLRTVIVSLNEIIGDLNKL